MPENTLLPLDADTIWTAYNSVLWAPRLPTGAELDTLKQQLQGHVQLLVPDGQDLVPRMRGEMRRLTVHVLVRAFQLLEECADGSPACDAFDLATMARALLTLYQHPGPLGKPTGAEEIAEEIRRRLCGACRQPIADGERTSDARSTVTPATASTATCTPSCASSGRPSWLLCHRRACARRGRGQAGQRHRPAGCCTEGDNNHGRGAQKRVPDQVSLLALGQAAPSPIRNRTFRDLEYASRNAMFEWALLICGLTRPVSRDQGGFMRIAHHRRVLVGAAASATAAMLVLTGTPADAQPASSAVASSANADSTALTQLAEGYLQQRADMLTTTRPTARAATARVRATRSMTAQVQDDLAALVEKGKRYKEVDGGYTKAQVDVEVTDTSVTGQSATLQLIERTRLHLPFTPQEVADGAPEYEEVSVPHTVKFTQGSDGAWLLSSDKADTKGGPTPTTQVSDVDAVDGADDGGGKAEEDEGSKDAASGTAPLPDNSDDSGDKREVRGYGYGKMVAYADKYWDHHNSAWRTYGTDCTNFISQAMHAGGWGPKGGAIIQRPSNKYWFYGPTTWTTSYTWAAAENWYWFAKKHSKRTKILDNVWKMAKSDVLQADWGRDNNIDHTMIVTKKYRGTPYLTYHTSDTHNKSLKKLLSDHPRAWWYAHRT